MQEIITLFETFGFPVGVCIACFYFIFITQKQTREDNKQREELLFNRIGAISKSLADVVTTLERINDRISEIEERVNKNEQ